MKKRNLLPFVGLAILGYLIYRSGINNLMNFIREIDIYLFLLSLVLFPIMIFFQTWKWQVLLEAQEFEVGFWKLFKMQWISLFYGTITPGRIGSFIKIMYLKDESGRPTSECISSVLIDRLLDFIMIAMMAVVGSLYLVKEFSNLYLQAVLFLASLLFGLWIITSKKRVKFFFRLFYKYLISKKIKEKLKEGFYGFYNNLPKVKSLIIPSLLTLILWVIIYTQVYLVALALSIDIPYLPFITIFPIGTIVGLIPITISGFGTRELVLVSLFNVFGATPESIIAMSLVWTISGFVNALIGGLLSFRKKKITEDL